MTDEKAIFQKKPLSPHGSLHKEVAEDIRAIFNSPDRGITQNLSPLFHNLPFFLLFPNPLQDIGALSSQGYPLRIGGSMFSINDGSWYTTIQPILSNLV